MTYVKSNEYGICILEFVGGAINVKDFSLKRISQECFADIEALEKVALITENRDFQIVFDLKNKRGCILLHYSSDTVNLLKIKELQFTSNVKPSEELGRLSHYNKEGVF